MVELSLSVQYGIQSELLTRSRIRRWVTKAMLGAKKDGLLEFKRGRFSVRLVGQAEARKLNASYRNKDYATNVLTFEYGMTPDATVSGDIIICIPVLTREAREQGKLFLDHAAHLTIHGVLHALGYDHIKAKDAKRMESLEITILGEMGIKNPYAQDD